MNIDGTSHESDSPTFLMGIYYQLISVETSRAESLRVPIQGRHLSLSALLFLFLPGAHPLAPRWSSPQPGSPTAQLHQESPLQWQKKRRSCWKRRMQPHVLVLCESHKAPHDTDLICLLRCLRQNGIPPKVLPLPKSPGENGVPQVRDAA